MTILNGANELGERATVRGEFEFLWDRIHADRGFGWDANPCTWAYEWGAASLTVRT